MIFSTELVRRCKPHPDTYLGVGRLLGLEPRQVMLAAAHNYDLRAAQDLGLRMAFIPRSREYGPLQSRDFEPEGNWDLVAHDLNHLAEQLGT
jgi:2-haloacid dehalogenase